jgi:hypothetical protein
MQGGASFADVLDAHLGCTQVPPVRPTLSNRPLTAPLFAFDLPRSSSTTPRATVGSRLHTPASIESSAARPVRPEPAQIRSEAPRVAARQEPRPAAERIRLTALESRALKALNALGADLDEHLSNDTLRRAFRQLARCYHPDRHPGVSAAERDRLAQLFVDATSHYRLLAAALEARLEPRG